MTFRFIYKNSEVFKATLATATSAFNKGISLLGALIITPIVFSYLGGDMFGALMAISSFSSLFSFFDLGTGSRLVNVTSEAKIDSTNTARNKELSIAIFITFIICTIVIIGCLLTNPKVYSGINYKTEYKDIWKSVLAFAAILSIQSIFSIKQKVIIGLNEGYQVNLFQGLGSLVTFLSIFAAVRNDCGFYGVVLASFAPNMLFTLLGVYFFSIKHPNVIKPSFSLITYKGLIDSIKKSFPYFLTTFLSVMATAMDKPLIAYYIDAEDVGDYSIAERYFQVSLLVQFVTMPYWPIFNNAISRGDYDSLKRLIFKLALYSNFLNVFICGLLIYFSESWLRIWMGDTYTISVSIILGYGLYRLVAGSIEFTTPLLVCGLAIKNYTTLMIIFSIISILTKFSLLAYFKRIDIFLYAWSFIFFVFYTIPSIWLTNLTLKNVRIKR